MDLQEVVAQADAAGLRLVRFLWCGNDGTIRAKASGRHGLEGRLERGIGVTRGDAGDERRSTSCSPSPGMGPVGEFRLCPTSTRSGCCRTRRTPARVLTDHLALDGDARGGLPARRS